MAVRVPNTHEAVIRTAPDGKIDGAPFSESDAPEVQHLPGDPAKGDDPALDVIVRAPGFNGVTAIRVKADADPTSGQRFLEDVHEIEWHDPEATSLGSTVLTTRPIA